MSTSTTVHCHDFINHPYERVRAVLLANPDYVFRHATAASAAGHATLHVGVGDLEVGAEVAIHVDRVEQDEAHGPVTLLSLRWEAARDPQFFPTMTAKLAIFPSGATETQLVLDGQYEPPLGPVGRVFDVAIGRELVQQSVARLVSDIAGWLREETTTAVAV